MENKEINALISLLDDPDEDIYSQVREKLLSIGEPVIPTLEEYWEKNSFDMVFQDRVEDLIHLIQFEEVKRNLENWRDSEKRDLLKGALLITQYQFPDYDVSKILESLDKIKQDIWLELHDNLTAFEKVKILNHIIFDVHGFSGNKTNYHAPSNCYINTVLESKKGNPLTLSILYMYLAQSLDIPIHGVNLPNHFIVSYKNESGKEDEDEILFYINTFSRGLILNQNEIQQFLTQLKIEPRPSFFRPCGHLSIVKRLLVNLINSYTKLGFEEKIKELEELYSILKN